MQDNPYHREVAEFFQFFQEWFGGTSPDTNEHYARITNGIPDDSTYINPKGELISTKSFFSGMRSKHGNIPGMRMWVDNIRLHWEEGDLALVTFEEWAQAPDAVPEGRMSTTIFRKKPETPNGIEWLHTHETLLPKTET